MGFEKREELDKAVSGCGTLMAEIPKEALFPAGKAFAGFRRQKGTRTLSLPDFFISAHAAVSGYPLVTRDIAMISSFFPAVEVVGPWAGLIGGEY